MEREAITPDFETLTAMAKAMVGASKGRLRLAYQEPDASEENDKGASHFLKLDGRRHGRDLELYRFLSTIQGGWDKVLPDLAIELVMPLRKDFPDAYAVGVGNLVAMGRSVYSGERLAGWLDILED